MADVAAIQEVIEEARPYDGDLPLFDAATALLALLDAAEARARALEAALVEERAKAEYGRARLCAVAVEVEEECAWCGARTHAEYDTWSESSYGMLDHDEDCPIGMAHDALERLWDEESMTAARVWVAALAGDGGAA